MRRKYLLYIVFSVIIFFQVVILDQMGTLVEGHCRYPISYTDQPINYYGNNYGGVNYPAGSYYGPYNYGSTLAGPPYFGGFYQASPGFYSDPVGNVVYDPSQVFQTSIGGAIASDPINDPVLIVTDPVILSPTGDQSDRGPSFNGQGVLDFINKLGLAGLTGEIIRQVPGVVGKLIMGKNLPVGDLINSAIGNLRTGISSLKGNKNTENFVDESAVLASLLKNIQLAQELSIEDESKLKSSKKGISLLSAADGYNSNSKNTKKPAPFLVFTPINLTKQNIDIDDYSPELSDEEIAKLYMEAAKNKKMVVLLVTDLVNNDKTLDDISNEIHSSQGSTFASIPDFGNTDFKKVLATNQMSPSKLDAFDKKASGRLLHILGEQPNINVKLQGGAPILPTKQKNDKKFMKSLKNSVERNSVNKNIAHDKESWITNREMSPSNFVESHHLKDKFGKSFKDFSATDKIGSLNKNKISNDHYVQVKRSKDILPQYGINRKVHSYVESKTGDTSIEHKNWIKENESSNAASNRVPQNYIFKLTCFNPCSNDSSAANNSLVLHFDCLDRISPLIINMLKNFGEQQHNLLDTNSENNIHDCVYYGKDRNHKTIGAHFPSQESSVEESSCKRLPIHDTFNSSKNITHVQDGSLSVSTLSSTKKNSSDSSSFLKSEDNSTTGNCDKHQNHLKKLSNSSFHEDPLLILVDRLPKAHFDKLSGPKVDDVTYEKSGITESGETESIFLDIPKIVDCSSSIMTISKYGTNKISNSDHTEDLKVCEKSNSVGNCSSLIERQISVAIKRLLDTRSYCYDGDPCITLNNSDNSNPIDVSIKKIVSCEEDGMKASTQPSIHENSLVNKCHFAKNSSVNNIKEIFKKNDTSEHNLNSDLCLVTSTCEKICDNDFRLKNTSCVSSNIKKCNCSSGKESFNDCDTLANFLEGISLCLEKSDDTEKNTTCIV